MKFSELETGMLVESTSASMAIGLVPGTLFTVFDFHTRGDSISVHEAKEVSNRYDLTLEAFNKCFKTPEIKKPLIVKVPNERDEIFSPYDDTVWIVADRGPHDYCILTATKKSGLSCTIEGPWATFLADGWSIREAKIEHESFFLGSTTQLLTAPKDGTYRISASRTGDTKLVLEYSNGSKVSFDLETDSPDKLRGFEFKEILVDDDKGRAAVPSAKDIAKVKKLMALYSPALSGLSPERVKEFGDLMNAHYPPGSGVKTPIIDEPMEAIIDEPMEALEAYLYDSRNSEGWTVYKPSITDNNRPSVNDRPSAKACTHTNGFKPYYGLCSVAQYEICEACGEKR